MTTCSRCGFTVAASGGICPRCGQTLVPLQSAAPPPHPALILTLESPDLPRKEFRVEDETVNIGRLDDSDIPVPHKSVSRQHARISPTPVGFEVEDVGSMNGTFVNDQQVTSRTPLNSGDVLLIGDVPVQVRLIQQQVQAYPEVIVQESRPVQPYVPQPQPLPPPPPLPPPGRPATGAPSTVFYDINDALAQAQPLEPARPNEVQEVPTAWDVTPARPNEAPPVIIDAAPSADHTLIAAEPAPSPVYDPRVGTPTRPDIVYDPRPAPPPPTRPDVGFDPRPAPPPPPTRPDVGFDPRPAPPPPPTRPDVGFDPRPAPPPPPTRPDVGFDPRPAPPPPPTRPGPTPLPSTPSSATAELSAVSMIELAERLATALRVLKGDLRLAMWLFDHAGGPAAAQAFVDQSQRAQLNPDNPLEQARLLDLAPTAARLLEAAIMLTNVVSSLEPDAGSDEEAQSNAANLDPIARA